MELDHEVECYFEKLGYQIRLVFLPFSDIGFSIIGILRFA